MLYQKSKKIFNWTNIKLDLALADTVLSSYGESTKPPTTFKIKAEDIEKNVVFMNRDTLSKGA